MAIRYLWLPKYIYVWYHLRYLLVSYIYMVTIWLYGSFLTVVATLRYLFRIQADGIHENPPSIDPMHLSGGVSLGDREAELNPEVKNPGWHRKLRRNFFSDLRRMTKRKGESNWKSGSGLRHFLRIQQPNKTTSRLWATSKSIRR
jgi:hypothetical protein